MINLDSQQQQQEQSVIPVGGFGGFSGYNPDAKPMEQKPAGQSAKTETKEEKSDGIDWSIPQNLSSFSKDLVAPADDDAFNDKSRYTPELASKNEKLIRDRMKKAKIDDAEIDRWIWNFKEESGLHNKREQFNTLPGAPKDIAGQRQYYFQNKHLYYYRVTTDKNGNEIRIPGSITLIPKDGKIPQDGRRFIGGQISGGGLYYGRTPLQLTHDHLYKKIGDRIGLDLVANPDLVFDEKVWPEVVIAYRELKMKEGHKFDTIGGVIKAIGPAKSKAEERARKAAEQNIK